MHLVLLKQHLVRKPEYKVVLQLKRVLQLKLNSLYKQRLKWHSRLLTLQQFSNISVRVT
ncbi:UNVERIFIED_CONTAM: hypothetical protein GPA08_24535 [Serratia marcescens]